MATGPRPGGAVDPGPPVPAPATEGAPRKPYGAERTTARRV